MHHSRVRRVRYLLAIPLLSVAFAAEAPPARAELPACAAAPCPSDAGKPVGEVRSTAISPRLGAIALATVRREVEPGATLAVHWDGGEAQADVSALPFPL